MDPVVKADRTSFSVFGNSPMVLVDPNGRTDYYNNRGKWIGTDGVSNNAKRMVLTNSTAEIVLSATKAGNNIMLNHYHYKDVVQIPNQTTLDKMSNSWYGTNTSNSEDSKEHAFAVGLDAKGLEVSSKIFKSTEATKVSMKEPISELKDMKHKLSYTVHTHPTNYTILGKGNDEELKYEASSHYPSRADVEDILSMTAILEDMYLPSDFQEIVIGPVHKVSRKESGELVFDIGAKVSFYTYTSNTLHMANNSDPALDSMEPNAQVDLKLFIKAATRANKRDETNQKCK